MGFCLMLQTCQKCDFWSLHEEKICCSTFPLANTACHWWVAPWCVDCAVAVMSDLSDSSGAGTSVDDSPQFVGDYGPKSLMMSTNDQQELKSPPLSPGSSRDSQPSTPPPIVGGDKKARGNAWNQFQLENKHAYAHETPKSRVSAMSKAFKDLKAGDGGAAALEALRAKDQARREGRKKLSMKLATTWNDLWFAKSSAQFGGRAASESTTSSPTCWRGSWSSPTKRASLWRWPLCWATTK